MGAFKSLLLALASNAELTPREQAYVDGLSQEETDRLMDAVEALRAEWQADDAPSA